MVCFWFSSHPRSKEGQNTPKVSYWNLANGSLTLSCSLSLSFCQHALSHKHTHVHVCCLTFACLHTHSRTHISTHVLVGVSESRATKSNQAHLNIYLLHPDPPLFLSFLVWIKVLWYFDAERSITAFVGEGLIITTLPNNSATKPDQQCWRLYLYFLLRDLGRVVAWEVGRVSQRAIVRWSHTMTQGNSHNHLVS